jgi:hypothetical protein
MCCEDDIAFWLFDEKLLKNAELKEGNGCVVVM